MSATSTRNAPHDLTCSKASRTRPTPNHLRRGALALSVADQLARSGQWSQWQCVEPRLAGFDSLEEAVEGWRRRDERCYQVVAGLASLGSRRGSDDDDAALAVVALLEEGVLRVAATLSDVCEADDVTATVWEEVKSAEPQLGCCAARYLLARARQRLSRPAAGMVSRIQTISLEQRLETNTGHSHGANSDGAGRVSPDRDLLLAAPEVEDPVEDLEDLLTWARHTGVLAPVEVDLLIDLLAAENRGLVREEAQRLVGDRHGMATRTVRRRHAAAAARLRHAAPHYLALIA